ncbi:MAG: DinB family protein, partial [Chloroflexota bacterium]|nr:DinB family protein [Chloroflexota bacterium]
IEIVKALTAGPTVLRGLCRGLDRDQARRRPAHDEWAVVEVVAHLADSDERALDRVRRMLAEDDPYLPGYDQAELARTGRYIDRNLGDELDRFERVRREHVTVLAGLDDAGWRRPGRHAEQGPMTVELYESHGAGEDADHFAQVARLVLAAA